MATRRALVRWGCLALLLLIQIVPKTSWADRRAEARRYFRQGMQLTQEGKPLEGIESLKKAYQTLPHQDVLYNIAQIYLEQAMTVEAIEYLRLYLEYGPPDASEIEVFIKTLEERLPRSAQGRSDQVGIKSSTVTVDLGPLNQSRALLADIARATGSKKAEDAAQALEKLRSALIEGATPLVAQSQPQPQPGAGSGQLSMPKSITSTRAAPARTKLIYDEAIVSASRYSQSPLDAPSSTYIITKEQIRTSGLSNIAELLRRVPGADVMTNSPADVNVSIRGFNQRLSNRMLVLIDGRSVYFDALGTVFWHNLTISPEDIERIEVIRGPASALYGADAFAGVVNIITILPGEDKTEIVASGGSHGWFHEHASTSGRAGALAYRFSIGYDSALRFSQELSDERQEFFRNFEEQDLGWRMVRANGSVSYRPSEDVGLILRGGATHGKSGWQAASGLRDFGMDADLNGFASAQLDTKFGTLRAFWNHSRARGGPQYVPIGNDPYLFDLTSNTLDIEALFAQEFNLIVPNKAQLGGSYRLKTVDWNYLDKPREENHFAVFVQDNMEIASWLNLQGSVRVDFHPLLEDPAISPRGALIVRPSRDSAIRLSAGTAFRTPSFLESYVNVGANLPAPAFTGTTKGSAVSGSTALKPESVLSAELAYQNTASSFFDFEVVGYLSQVRDLTPLPSPSVDALPRLADLTGAYGPAQPTFDPFLDVYTVGDATYTNEDSVYNSVGGELNINAYPVDGLDIYLNYALQQVLLDEGDFSQYKFEDRTSTHKLNAGIRYRSAYGIDLQADFHFASEQTWRELTLGSASLEALRPIDYYLPSYYLVNARLGYHVIKDTLEVGVVGFNVTDNRHRQHPFGQLLGARVLGTLRLTL